jgi:hypothetical protein
MSETYHGSEDGYTKPKEKVQKEPSPRKSLAIDVETYEMLRDICGLERRSLINQLQQLIEQRHNELFDGDYR